MNKLLSLKHLPLLALVYLVQTSYAQVASTDSTRHFPKLHALFFADTNMKGFGSGVESAYFKMKDEAVNIAKKAQLNLQEYSYLGQEFTASNLSQAIETLEVSSDDVIFFYFVGNGFRYENQKSQWPNLFLDQGRWSTPESLSKKSIALTDVYAKLKAKKARLVICAADASHAKEFVQFPTSRENQVIEYDNLLQKPIATYSNREEKYKALYKESKGSILLAGCSPNQLSEIDPHPRRGSALSWAFVNASHQKESKTSWNQLLEKTASLTQGFFINTETTQQPLFVTEIETGVKKISQNSIPVLANNATTAPKIWGIFVGVSNYENPIPTFDKLHYTDDDAYLLYSFYKSPAGGALPDEQLTVLVDENATKEAILAAVDNAVRKANPQDIILLYYSGHGVKGGILPYDYYPQKQETRLTYHKIKDLLDKGRAKKKLIISDACFAGTLVASRGNGIGKSLNDFYNKIATANEGTILLASSRPREFSKEYDGLRQGVFSYFMMEGLKGKADQGVKDGIITINELYEYISVNVRRRTDGEQNPMIFGKYDPNTPLSNVKAAQNNSPLNVRAVIVGVSAYQTFNGLNYADDDAYQLYSFFKSPQGGALPDSQIQVLVDQNAYRDNIIKALEKQLKRAGPNDLVVFYFAGHASEKAFYPYDYNGTTNRLSYETIKSYFNTTQANKKLWIADACHSGGIKGTPIEAWKKIMVKQKGTALLMSSRKEQKSYERNDLRQGIFSYYLIKGLKGHSPAMKTTRANADCDFTCKFVTIAGLFDYIKENVERETNNTQRPDIDGDYNPAMPVGWVGVEN